MKIRGLATAALLTLGIAVSTTASMPSAEGARDDWRQVLSGLPTYPVGLDLPASACPRVTHCWVAGSGDAGYRALRTADGGNSWQPWDAGAGRVLAVSFAGQQFGLAAATEGVARTTNGATWAKVADNLFYQVIAVTNQVAYASALDGTYRSDNGGVTWVKVASWPLPKRVQFLDADIAWGIHEGQVQFTANGARGWTQVFPDPVGNEYASVFFLNHREGWAGRFGKLAHTSDAGQTWQTYDLPNHNGVLDGLVFVDGSTGYALSALYGVIRSDDGGRSWQSDGPFVGTHGAQFTFFDKERGWAIQEGAVQRRAPKLALTPTATATMAPGTTATATRTPFAPPVPTGTIVPTSTPAIASPTPTVASPTPAPPCSWAGQWQTMSSGQPFSMTLTEAAGLPGQRSVRGSYGPDDRRIEATASGATLTGRWSGPPSYSEPDHAGRFRFTISGDCRSFSGTWGFGPAESGGGAWTGNRVSDDSSRAAMAVAAYRGTLCRDPEPDALAYWSGASVSQAGLEAELRASGEYAALQPARNAYLGVLARDPVLGDCQGLRYWAGTGLTQAGIEPHLAASDEGRRIRGIRDLYLELLGRDPLGPDTAALRHWAISGLTLDQIRQAILASDEYRRRPR